MRCGSWPLEALEDVNSAATAVASERGNLTNANFLRFVGVRASAFGDALGTGAALLQNVAAAELAVQGALGVSSVALDRHTVRGGNERSGGGGSKNQERLEHGDKALLRITLEVTCIYGFMTSAMKLGKNVSLTAFVFDWSLFARVPQLLGFLPQFIV